MYEFMYMCVHMCARGQRTTSANFRLVNKGLLAWNSLISPGWPITRSHDQSFSACITPSWTLQGSGNHTDPHTCKAGMLITVSPALKSVFVPGVRSELRFILLVVAVLFIEISWADMLGLLWTQCTLGVAHWSVCLGTSTSRCYCPFELTQ